MFSEGDNRWFGPEVQSWILCEPPENWEDTYNPDGFFDITNTNEQASISNHGLADRIQWDRTQTWDFGTNGPWGTNQSIITLEKVMWANNTGGSSNGFPWNGVEIHWRHSSGDVKSQTDVTGWEPGPDDDQDGRADWICPKMYKYGGWVTGDYIETVCRQATPDPPPVGDWERETDWDDPEQHNGTLARYGNTLDIWIDCIPAD